MPFATISTAFVGHSSEKWAIENVSTKPSLRFQHLKCCSFLVQQKHWNAALGQMVQPCLPSPTSTAWAYQQWMKMIPPVPMLRCEAPCVKGVDPGFLKAVFFRISGAYLELPNLWSLGILCILCSYMATSHNMSAGQNQRLRAAECDFMCWSQVEPISHHIAVVKLQRSKTIHTWGILFRNFCRNYISAQESPNSKISAENKYNCRQFSILPKWGFHGLCIFVTNAESG